jgi:hypothetical protein
MNKLSQFVLMVMVSATVSALALGIYDKTVRQPRTPRLGVVDISKLYSAVEQRAKDAVLKAGVGSASGVSDGASSRAAEVAGSLALEGFGPQIERVLTDLSAECGCVIVAMAAVMGGTTSVPDYTAVAAQRLGVALRVASTR